jgi:hypothetical protein
MDFESCPILSAKNADKDGAPNCGLGQENGWASLAGFSILDYGRWSSTSTTSECSCTRSRTTSAPSAEMSKSRISKSGGR